MNPLRPIDWSPPVPPTDTDLCGVGRYKHTPLADVPKSFFEWLANKQNPYVPPSEKVRRALEYYTIKYQNIIP